MEDNYLKYVPVAWAKKISKGLFLLYRNDLFSKILVKIINIYKINNFWRFLWNIWKVFLISLLEYSHVLRLGTQHREKTSAFRKESGARRISFPITVPPNVNNHFRIKISCGMFWFHFPPTVIWYIWIVLHANEAGYNFILLIVLIRNGDSPEKNLYP